MSQDLEEVEKGVRNCWRCEWLVEKDANGETFDLWLRKMDMPGVACTVCSQSLKYSTSGKKKFREHVDLAAHQNVKLVKVDTAQRKAVYWREAGYVPGEPVFVARPGAQAEDDGVVLSAVLSELPHTPSFLLVLDAHTFQELGRALAPRDVKMAMSFHGSFVPDAK